MKEKSKDQLPFNINPSFVAIFDRVASELKTISKDGISEDSLLKNIGESKNRRAKRVIDFIEYLGLIESNGRIITLTRKGSIVFYASSKELRNQRLIEHLPEMYQILTKWIYHNKDSQMTSIEFKDKYVREYGNRLKDATLENGLNSYMNYAKHIGLIDYKGRGNLARGELTDIGKKALNLTNIESSVEGTAETPNEEKPARQINKNETRELYPITIITKDRGSFAWDIRTEEDLKVLDSVIATIKSSWRKKFNKNGVEEAPEINDSDTEDKPKDDK